MSDDGDKTEEPTEHKLQEARKKGQVMKSQELVSTAMLMVTAGVLAGMGGWMFREIMNFTRMTWGDLMANSDFQNRDVSMDMLWIVVAFLKILAPLLAGAFVVAVLINVAQVRFMFSTEPLMPQLSKINPLSGFKKIFSMKSLMELVKQIAKLTVIGWIVYKVVKYSLPDLVKLLENDIFFTVTIVRTICIDVVKKVWVGMLVIAIVDYVFQKKQFMKGDEDVHAGAEGRVQGHRGKPPGQGKDPPAHAAGRAAAHDGGCPAGKTPWSPIPPTWRWPSSTSLEWTLHRRWWPRVRT